LEKAFALGGGGMKTQTDILARWAGIGAFATDLDEQPALDAAVRSTAQAKTYERVWPERNRMGITRVADLTDYDFVGIPVVSACRPRVDDAQVTATQGKGDTKLQAFVSALMEAVERYSAATATPARFVANANDLMARERCVVPSEMGAPPSADTDAIEWVHGICLQSGESCAIPACDVLFPYYAPKGVARPFKPSTNGLASGNTRIEAISQALCEVVERNTVSHFMRTEQFKVVPLETIDQGLPMELVARFQNVGLEVVVMDVSEHSPLPVYYVWVFGQEGVGPWVPCAGYGAHVLPRVALVRALLEAAQSRVVAIQGSREDLIRRTENWEATREAALKHWQRVKKIAARGQTINAPTDETGPKTPLDNLVEILTRLESHGYEKVVVTDLTNSALGIPVVSANVIGMVDQVIQKERISRDERARKS
jgi:ribosomal protein S12 methylthiotransferase accessory factor